MFSAVLTAFLVESYKLLQPDHPATTAALLRHIVLESDSCRLSSGLMNPSTLDITSTDFEPSLNAVRVNVLWFAALVFSLSTASFGILVKTWLREYLAGDYTSGQARLRVRQFRHPGLADWKVFEIAAVLPLLLQLALGLFLLGLCFFTWSVHRSVGLASTPLVAAWAVLFFSSIVAPVLSPRCPFKLTLLRRALSALRRLLWSVPPIGITFQAFQRRHVLPKPGGTFASETALTRSLHPRPYEEEDAAKDERQDLSILASVDAILQDDDLLGSTMLESLQQAQFEAGDVTDFVFGAIQRRLPIQYNIKAAATPPSSLLDLRQLRKQGWEAVVDILADIVAKAFIDPSRPPSCPPWMAHALLLFSSFHNYPLTTNGNRALALCLTGPEARECTAEVIATRTAPLRPGNLAHILRRVRPASALLAPGDVVWSVLSIMHHAVCRDHRHNDDQLVEFFRAHNDSQLPVGTTHIILGILMDCVNREVASSGSAATNWSEWTRHALRALLSCDIPSDARHEVSRLVCTLTRRSNTSFGTLLNVVAMDKKDRAAEEPALFTFENAFADAEVAGR